MTKKPASIRETLIKSYILIIALLAVSFSAAFLFWQIDQISRAQQENIRQSASTISLSIDDEISKMDTVSLNIIYSNLVKDNFAAYTGYALDDGTTSSERNSGQNKGLENAKVLIDLLTAIMGPNRPVQQVYLHGLSSGSFGIGVNNSFTLSDTSRAPWYNEVIARSGSKVYYGSHIDPNVSRYVTTDEDKRYFSILRMYYDHFNQAQGIVEVEQYYDSVFRQADLFAKSDRRLYIYDGNSLLYPQTPVDNSGAYPALYDPSHDGELFTIENPSTGDKEAVCFVRGQSGLTTLVAIRRSVLFEPIYRFTLAFVLILLCVLATAFSLAYVIAKRITRPINEMYRHVSSLNVEQLKQELSGVTHSGIVETDALLDALKLMQGKLDESISKLLLSQRQEMQSHMLALQSQMNPHFLYNSLSTIGAMADEGMSEQVSAMCSNISDILRYISSNKQALVSLDDELDNTYKYLCCLKLRYGDQLTYSIDIPDDMLDIQAPKLCVQLLVENAVKFTTTQSPPWHIAIVAQTNGSEWTLCVIDNGGGFSKQALQTLDGQIAQINKTGLLPNLELDGMGLMNVYIRLKLCYDEHTIFDICNREKGATVTIGGQICANSPS